MSAYFSIYGYGLLADVLDDVSKVKFLFGDPRSVGHLDPNEKELRSFSITENGLIPNHVLRQKYLAQRCADWVRRDQVEIRSVVKSNFLHGKMYLTKSPGSTAAVVGSSNFTKRGLGGSEHPNMEINLAVQDSDVITELREWFDKVWKDGKLTKDVKQRVLDALERVGKEYSPEFVYFKTLYELFREELDARSHRELQLKQASLYDSQIWKTLYKFQKDGAENIITRLQRHNGCILADSVGLGKTYTALAVIKYFELRNENVLVLCPRKLRDNWALYQATNRYRGNPFQEDRFLYSVLSHTDLSRTSGYSGDINLADFQWENFGLVVIDESHNFRNDGGGRYRRLLDEVIEQGVSTKVLMLSATPVNTSLKDLRNQIYIMTEKRRDHFRETLGISDIGTVIEQARRRFEEWQSSLAGNKAELLGALSSEFYRLLGAVSISRSRRHIRDFYSEEIKRIGSFPHRERPKTVYPPTDLYGQLSYDDMSDKISQFKLSIYLPSSYIVSEERKKQLEEEERRKHHFSRSDRERFLIGMIRINFLKRLESSAHSLTMTLGRTIGKIDGMLEKIESFEHKVLTRDEELDVLPDDDDDDDEFLVNRARNPYHLSDIDLPRWRDDLNQDKAVLTEVYERVKQITVERDGKLAEIKSQIEHRINNPTINKDGKENRKILIFTTFKDTAQYLYENLKQLVDSLKLNMAMVTGDVTYTTAGKNGFNFILDNFAPIARQRKEADRSEEQEIDILIATDCISEGQNLQDCDTVLNYDIHWNPVRIIQRFGRIDRIGSRSRAVYMINYWPTKEMQKYLRLQTSVQARMVLVDTVATGDENLLDQQGAIQSDTSFRDRHIQQLLQEIPDLDDSDEDVVMTDFTFDTFIHQLLQYLEKNREELERAPAGVYAVTDCKDPEPGVIWVLRQRNASKDKRTSSASALHPFYLVYVRENGDIRYGCANVMQILKLFQEAAYGKGKYIKELCDQFNNVTENGARMELYNKLLNKTVLHISQAHEKRQTAGLGRDGRRDFTLPRSTETPNNLEDFELVTWLVVRPEG